LHTILTNLMRRSLLFFNDFLQIALILLLCLCTILKSHRRAANSVATNSVPVTLINFHGILEEFYILSSPVSSFFDVEKNLPKYPLSSLSEKFSHYLLQGMK
jgi:hypothetical protein